jgi:DNA-binding NarL/FixJ family response regulator
MTDPIQDHIRILIADDHPVVRTGLGGMIANEPDLEIVAEAADGSEAQRLASHHQPDVVLMDLKMPEIDGVTATASIREHHPEVQVLVLTTYNSDADILKALEAGATGYLLKDAPKEELFDAIRKASEGKSSLTPDVASRVVERMRVPSEEGLSSRETEILELVAAGTSNKEIAKDLWVSETTVKSHLLNAFEKLGVNDRTAAVTTALKRGLIHLDS